MKVFIVARLDWDDFNVTAVLASKLLAEAFVEKMRARHPGYAWWICERHVHNDLAVALDVDSTDDAWTYEAIP